MKLRHGSVRVSFVNTPTQHYKEPRLESLGNYSTIPPLGLGYVATAASEVIGSDNVKLIDAEHLRLSSTETARRIVAQQPTYVGINATSPNYAIASEIVRMVGTALGQKIIVGGTHAILCADRILQDASIAEYLFGVCPGDGEPTIQSLLRGTDRSRIPNFKYRDADGKIVVSPYQERLSTAELNERYLDRRFFLNDPLVYGETVESYLLSSRGCPFQCAFCAAPQVGTKFSRRSDKSLHTEIGTLISSGVNYLRFVDDLLLSSEKRAWALKGIFDALDLDRLNFRFEATARADIAARFKPTTWQMLARIGLSELEIGIESGSPRVLQLMGKRTTTQEVVTTLQEAVDNGIKVKGFLMVGYPTETQSDLELTFELACRLKDIGGGAIRFSPVIAKAYPGTELYETYQSSIPCFSNDTLLDLTDWCSEPYPANTVSSLKARTRYNAVHTHDGHPVVLSELTGGASLKQVLDMLGKLVLISGPHISP